MTSQRPRFHLIGFGSQGAVWAESLRASGWDVEVYLARRAGSYARAAEMGFAPRSVEELQGSLSQMPLGSAPAHLIGVLTPDHLIGEIYTKFISKIEHPITLVLAHGYAVYARELVALSAGHEAALFAPKAIGPKLREAAKAAQGAAGHDLVAGISVSAQRRGQLLAMARDLGFRPENLVETSFEHEAIGDLISEQGLLCGTTFTFLKWTMEAMARAGVPAGLIREECMTELALIAGLIRERGPATTFQAISQAAQCGTIAMNERLEKSGFKAEFDRQVEEVVSRRFVDRMNRGDEKGEWKEKARALIADLDEWEGRLKK